MVSRKLSRRDLVKASAAVAAASQFALAPGVGAQEIPEVARNRTLILRWANEAGYHLAMNWLTGECGYAPPQPLAPGDELAQLQREFIASVKSQQQLAARIERLMQPLGPRAVA